MFYRKIAAWSTSVCLSFLGCCCSVTPIGLGSIARASEVTQEEDQVERDYLVKGMTCSGCVFGVKKALERAGVPRSEILAVEYNKPDPVNSIGHAKVRFPKSEYKGKETDCKIAKEILSNPGYQVFWDKADQNPCKL